MPFPSGPRSPSFGGVRPPPTVKGPPSLGVGWRVLVACQGGGSERVTLTDDTGTSALATVAHGIEVEILAWRPRRGGDTRYRVVSTSGGIEGWLSATNLQARRPPPPKVLVAVPPKAVVAVAPARRRVPPKAVVAVAPARRSVPPKAVVAVAPARRPVPPTLAPPAESRRTRRPPGAVKGLGTKSAKSTKRATR